jgi:methylthioribose-1-phosphate isomerase
MRGVLATGAGAQRLLAEAEAIAAEDLAANRRMAKLGADALQPGVRVLTICNTGSLATAGLGTALGVIREAHRRGWLEAVYACETRPANQGARLTLWELSRDGIPASLIVDSAAAALMASGRVDWVITGADRITANGDVINKIGTYALALAAHVHGVRTMVVAPSSSLDPDTATGSQVVIEERPPGEIQAGLERAWNPVFDCTPVALVDCIVTERGCLVEPARTGLAGLSRGAAN